MLQIDDDAVDALTRLGGLRITAAEILADQVLLVHAHDDHFHFAFEDQSA